MPNLLICLTPGGSLAKWKQLGTLEREMRLYIDYLNMGWNIKILSFKGESASEYDLPDGIKVIRFPHTRLLPMLPFLRPDIGIWSDVIKTNQSLASWYYVNAAKRWNKPILLRCGYVAGRNIELENGKTNQVVMYQKKESKAFANATKIQVTTPLLSKWIQSQYNINPEKISILPNFVDTELFSPLYKGKRKPKSVISIGRLNKIKRFDMLIKACKRAGVNTLTIVGEGPERNYLETLAKQFQLNVLFTGQIANERIPEILSNHEIYAQVSQFEGHPKSLIESMSCSLPCLVTNNPGLNDQIVNKVTGLIVECTVDSIAEGLSTIIKDKLLADSLGHAAREYVVTTMEYIKIRDIELNTLNSLSSQGSSYYYSLR